MGRLPDCKASSRRTGITCVWNPAWRKIRDRCRTQDIISDGRDCAYSGDIRTSYFPAWRTALSIDAAGSCADSGSRNYHDSRTFVVRHDDRNESGNDARDLDDGDISCGADVREIL